MKILLINHTSDVSGAEVVLMGLARSLAAEHEVAIACPGRGPLRAAVRAAGLRHVALPRGDVSLRPHPVRTPLGVGRLGLGGLAVRRAAAGLDVVHANSPRAGLMAAVSSLLGGPPAVVSVHDVLPASRLGRLTRAVLDRTAAAVVPVSQHAARKFATGMLDGRVSVVQPPVDHARFDPARVGVTPLREELGLPGDAVLVGQVAQITPWKGQDLAIRTFAALRDACPRVHLVLVGGIAFAGTRLDNEGYLRSLHALVAELGLGGRVHLLGRRDDVPGLLRSFAFTVLPSQREPFGLAALESMAMGIPPVVGADGGAAEYVADGVSGRVVEGRDPAAWAQVVRELLEAPEQLERMGAQARQVASRFDQGGYARSMLAVYERVRGTS